ncbi:MAG: GTP cyclohydrolase I FolE [Oligoflexales bacterium]
MAERISEILCLLGEDKTREGLRDTPMRYAKALLDLTRGYQADFKEIVNDAVFSLAEGEIVLVRDIEFSSLCEHHLLPFYGRAHVAYLPNEKVIGLSKIPRIVNAYAKRLQLQEQLTRQVATELMEQLAPRGVAVIMEADHMCMMMRGVEKRNSKTVTAHYLGAFKEDRTLRSELHDLLRNSTR